MSDFGTDPETLTREQLVVYVRQLQQTVVLWQEHAAKLAGITREEMIMRARS